jgi:hypothetical protein
MKYIRTYLVASFCFFSIHLALSQFQFSYQQSITVNKLGLGLTLPWAGGLNYAQVSEIDIDYDNDKDLFVFDRSNNQIRVFQHDVVGMNHQYSFLPNSHGLFPADIRYRAFMADYNGDGKNDLFTYAVGGIMVYKNTGDAVNGLSWVLAKSLLYSDYWGSNLNLYVSSSDIPAIVDVDLDGDLDILTFHIGGQHVQYHQNQSIELYGNADSLIYVLKNECWGGFREDVTTNTLFLNDQDSPCLTGNVPNPAHLIHNKPISPDNKAHSGSTLLALDIDGSGVKDLIVGDVSYPTMNLLINGGIAPNTNSLMVSVDPAFPSNSVAVNMQLFPAAYSVDVDFDGVKDLLVAPNARGVSENEKSLLYYKNTGSNAVSNFVYQTKAFLQEDMIEHGTGSIPVFADVTGDGLLDMFVCNFYAYKPTLLKESRIAYYKNTGTLSQPVFTFIDSDFLNLSQANYGLRMIASFGDLDGDSKPDLILGLEDGSLVYRKNISTGASPLFGSTVTSYPANNGSPINVGQFASPQLFDLNGDGKLDLLIGKKTGEIIYYENIGTTLVPSFQLITSTLGGVDVSTTTPDGFPYPHFFRHNDTTFLLVGAYDGQIRFYDGIDGSLNGNFNLRTDNFLGLDLGAYSACSVNDIDNDSKLDLFVGQDLGGVFHLEHDANSNLGIGEQEESTGFFIHPNPTSGLFCIESTKIGSAITIMDEFGRLCQTLIIDKNTTWIDLSSLSNGIYFLKMHGDINVLRLVKF